MGRTSARPASRLTAASACCGLRWSARVTSTSSRALSDEVFEGGASHERQEAWFRENGPTVPELLEHLREHGTLYDLVLFWTYRYYPSFFGVPLVRERAVLVPTAEEDKAIWLDGLQEYLASRRLSLPDT